MGKKSFHSAAVYFMCTILTGCSWIVEPVEYAELSPDNSLQEKFKVQLNPLTFETAKTLNAQPYERMVSRPGRALSANAVNEREITIGNFPEPSSIENYKIGVSDNITFIQHTETPVSLAIKGTNASGSEDNIETISPNSITTPQVTIISTSGRVGTDGSLLLLGIGKLQAAGREIEQLRDEVRSILIRNGKIPNFQLEISSFNSQKAFLTTDLSEKEGTSAASAVIPLTDRGSSLRELVTNAGIALDERVLTIIRLLRDGKFYQFTLADLLSEKAPEVFIKNNDHIFIQRLNYLDGQVFLIGGVEPLIIPIKAEERRTLSTVLFAPNGPLSTPTAQRSAVYLLRGSDPIHAYHLDIQNPSRVLVADAVQMRPNDIIFVAEQPITTFARALANILPLRVFSRDVENKNFP